MTSLEFRQRKCAAKGRTTELWNTVDGDALMTLFIISTQCTSMTDGQSVTQWQRAAVTNTALRHGVAR